MSSIAATFAGFVVAGLVWVGLLLGIYQLAT